MMNFLIPLLLLQFYSGHLQDVQLLASDSLWSLDYALTQVKSDYKTTPELLELNQYFELFLANRATTIPAREVTFKSLNALTRSMDKNTEELALFNIIVEKLKSGRYPDKEIKTFKENFAGSRLYPYLKLQEALFNVRKGDTLLAIQALKDLLEYGGDIYLIKSALLWIGKLSILTGNYKDGNYYLNKFTKLFPHDPVAKDLNLILLVLSLKKRDFETASSIIKENNFKESDKPLVLLISGYMDILQGKFALARKELQASDSLPADAIPLKTYLLGFLDYKAGNTSSAISRMDSVIQSGKKALIPYAKFIKILAFKKSAKHKKYVNSLEDFINSYPDSKLTAYAAYLLGLEYFKKNELDKALQYFEKARDLAQELPIKPQVYFMLGEISFLKKDYKDAINYFSVAQDGLNDNNYKSYVSLRIIMSLYNLNKLDDLVSYSEEVLKTAPDSVKEWIHFYRAKTYMKMKMYQYTEDELVHIIRSRAFGDVLYYAYFERGLLHYKLKHYRTAEKYFYQVISNYSDTSKIYELSFLYIGDCKFNRHQYGLAARYYEKFLEMHPQDNLYYSALWQLGLTYYRMRKYDRALDVFNKVYSSNIKKSLKDSALFMMAECYKSLEDYEKAAEIYTQIYKDPSSHFRALALYKLGDMYYNQEMYENAYETYRKIIEEFPSSDLVDDAIEGFLQSAGKIGKDQEAYAFFDSLIYNSPPVIAATLIFKKGEYQFNQGWYEEAIKTFQEIVNRYPSQKLLDKAYFWIGMAYVRLDSCDSAIANFEKAAKIPESYYYIAECYFKKQDFVNARDNMLLFLKNAHNQTIKYPEAYRVLAYSYINLGDTTAADSMMQQLLMKYPDNPAADEARLYLASRLAQRAEYDSAMALIKVIKKNRSDEIAAKASLLLADIYRDMGEIEEAIIEYITTYRIYEKLYPEVAEQALVRAGELYEQQNRLEEALTVYRRAIRKFPNAPDREELEKKAKEIEQKLIEEKLKKAPQPSPTAPESGKIKPPQKEEGQQ